MKKKWLEIAIKVLVALKPILDELFSDTDEPPRAAACPPAPAAKPKKVK